MIDRLLFTSTLLSALGCGLMAGFFFAFSAAVMTALARLPPDEGISAMKSINVAVINPVFFTVFFGTALLCVLVAAIALLVLPDPGAYYLLAGSLLYIAGAVLVTVVFNVPLNNMLASLDPDSLASADRWREFLRRWTAWNHVRTAASICAMASFIMALAGS